MSIAPTTWSNDSSTLFDTLVMHSYYALAPFILPIPPLALIAHRLYDQVNGMLGHAGFEYFASASTQWPSPMVCVTFHDQHHSAFRFNYGNFTSIWDRLMGTLTWGIDQNRIITGIGSHRDFSKLGFWHILVMPFTRQTL